MNAAHKLSAIAILLSTVGIAILTFASQQLSVLDFISRLNEINAQYQAFGNGLFMIIGVFWIGSVDTTRRLLEPKKMDGWIRFAGIAFAASYLLSVIFPCDEGCPYPESLNQMIHSSVVWLLYSLTFAVFVRVWMLSSTNYIRVVIIAATIAFVLMQLDAIVGFFGAGLWQRLYDILFCMAWWHWLALQFPRQTLVAKS